jgi:hypothetical protein
MLNSRWFRTAVTLAPLCGLPALARPTAADVKVVSNVTVTGSARPAAQRQVVTCVKGDVVRTETGGTVSLYNAREQSVTTIDTEKKTYKVVSLKQSPADAFGILSRVNFRATASMDAKPGMKTVAGKPARRYVGKAVLTMSLQGMPATAARQTTMEIEQWATEAIPLPATLAAGNPLLRVAGPLKQMPGMAPLMKALAKVKGMPLSSRVTVVSAGPDGSPMPPVVTNTEVVSVTEGSLPAALFRAPQGYRKLEAAVFPSAPEMLRSAKSGTGHKH